MKEEEEEEDEGEQENREEEEAVRKERRGGGEAKGGGESSREWRCRSQTGVPNERKWRRKTVIKRQRKKVGGSVSEPPPNTSYDFLVSQREREGGWEGGREGEGEEEIERRRIVR